MSLGVAQQVGTKNGGYSSKNKQNNTLCTYFNLFPEKPPGLVGIKISYFFNYFFIFFFRADVTQTPTTKICTLNRGGMWPTENQERFLKTGKQVRSPKTASF